MTRSSEIAAIQTVLPMTYQEHQQLRQDVLEAESDLRMCALPTRFITQLSKIPVTGDIPLSLRGQVGRQYNHLSFTSTKGTLGEDPSVSIMLFGSQPQFQAEIVSVAEPVSMGRDKQFDVKPYGSTRATTRLDCDEVGLLLDSMTGGATRVAELTDPRLELPFDDIALSMNSTLQPLAKSTKTELTYSGRDLEMSSEETGYYTSESGSRLVTKDCGGHGQVQLTLTAPFDLGDHQVVTHFKYEFERPRLIKSGRITVQAPESPAEASLTLVSSTLPRVVLSRFLEAQRAKADPSLLGRRALEHFNSSLI